MTEWVLVPREPTPEVIADVVQRVDPASLADYEVAKAASALLPPTGHPDGPDVLAELVRDYRALVNASAAPASSASESGKAELIAFEDCQAVAKELGYPSLTEALEDLERLKSAPQPVSGESEAHDKIEGLEAELFEAVQVAYRRGAVEWARLNYPKWIERLQANAEADPIKDEEPVLPHNIVIGHITFRKGVKLSTFEGAARRWFFDARSSRNAEPTPEPPSHD